MFCPRCHTMLCVYEHVGNALCYTCTMPWLSGPRQMSHGIRLSWRSRPSSAAACACCSIAAMPHMLYMAGWRQQHELEASLTTSNNEAYLTLNKYTCNVVLGRTIMVPIYAVRSHLSRSVMTHASTVQYHAQVHATSPQSLQAFLQAIPQV